jgi:hypothetical protein
VVLLNIVYGLIIALMALGIAVLLGYGMAWYEFLGLWVIWSVGHIIYDTIAYWLVKFFNRTKVYRGE